MIDRESKLYDILSRTVLAWQNQSEPVVNQAVRGYIAFDKSLERRMLVSATPLLSLGAVVPPALRRLRHLAPWGAYN